MKTCLNPKCPVVEFILPDDEDSTEACMECGFRSCEHCGSFYDPDEHLSDRCIYCNDKGRIDCDDKNRSLEFCRGCGSPCSHLDDLEEENE